MNASRCNNGDELSDVYQCYKDQCFDEKTTNILCLNEYCDGKIRACLQSNDKACGELYLSYLRQKQDCYDSVYEPSGLSRCRCRQEGDINAYYEPTEGDYDDNCIAACNQCVEQSWGYLSQLCTTDKCPEEFLNILGCVMKNCTEDYNKYVAPNKTEANYINEIEDCGYEELCETMLLRCWADEECFKAFFGGYDKIMDILLNNIYLLRNDVLFTITNFTILTASIDKYFCTYPDYDITCNDIFWDLMECILNQCIFENQSNCFWNSCSTELLGCIGPHATLYPARCNQALLWLSYTYFPGNGMDNTVILEYVNKVDAATEIGCTDESEDLQCYYYNVVGYCLLNKCLDEFWDVVDCIFMNRCLGDDTKKIDYKLSGTSRGKYESICVRDSWSYLILYSDYHGGPLNACQKDWFRLAYCKWSSKPESSLFLNNASSIDSVNDYLISEGFTQCPFNRSLDITMAIYPNCLEGIIGPLLGVWIDSMVIHVDWISYDEETRANTWNMVKYRNYRDVTVPVSGSADDPNSSPYDLNYGDLIRSEDTTKKGLKCEIVNTSEPTMFPTAEPTNMISSSSIMAETSFTSTDNAGNGSGRAGKGDDTDNSNMVIIVVISVIIVILLIVAAVVYYCKYMKKSEHTEETQMHQY